jgi:hypothetical protein
MKMTVYQHKQGLWKGYWFYGWETGQSSPFPTRKAAEQALAFRKQDQKIADHIDGYDRDDLSESPDF